jgi:hypothetical protein
MILSESAINEIRAALASGDGADLVRQLAEEGMQDLIEAEGTEHIGADRWECTCLNTCGRDRDRDHRCWRS